MKNTSMAWERQFEIVDAVEDAHIKLSTHHNIFYKISGKLWVDRPLKSLGCRMATRGGKTVTVAKTKTKTDRKSVV